MKSDTRRVSFSCSRVLIDNRLRGKKKLQECERLNIWVSAALQPYPAALQPGDVLFFTEAATHGTLPWSASHTRRACLYRFAPATSAYGEKKTAQ